MDMEVGERKQSRLAPLIDGGFDLGVPHQVGRAVGSSLLNRKVVVGASDLVLGAVLALGKALVTADVALLTSLTALAGLGVAKKRSAWRARTECRGWQPAYLRRGGPPPGPAIVAERGNGSDMTVRCWAKIFGAPMRRVLPCRVNVATNPSRRGSDVDYTTTRGEKRSGGTERSKSIRILSRVGLPRRHMIDNLVRPPNGYRPGYSADVVN